MPYITREDGERFVIPSYRDVLSAKKRSLLKREVLLLSTNYGEYITLHRKNVDQYEVAFSPDPGYLLGESVWHYFKRPFDLIYCEAIPNTTDAILVVVKSGSVYLDGTFPLDSIIDELIIFKTQQNHFDIYIYGEVPLSQEPEPGKLSFDHSSVKSFTILDEPVFPTLPTLKTFQLQLVETVLRSQGIGTLPIKQMIIGIVALGLLWMTWVFLTTHKKELPKVIIGVVNPYQVYMETLSSPDPTQELKQLYYTIRSLYSMPGWYPVSLDYSKGQLRVAVKSRGTRTNFLFDWAQSNRAIVEVLPEGFFVKWKYVFANRMPPATISPLKQVVATAIDNLSYVLPGNHVQLTTYLDRRSYLETTLTISFSDITPNIFALIEQVLQNLPLVLNQVSMQIGNDGYLSGTIVLQALGT